MAEISPWLQRILKTRTLRQSTLLTAGTGVNSVLGLVFYIILARTLGVNNFGDFSYILGIGILASELGDLGLSSSLVKFGQKNFESIFTLVLSERIVVGIGIFLLAVGASRVFPDQYILSALAAISLLLLSLVTQSYLSKQKYGYFVCVNIFGNVCRLFIVWLLLSWKTLGIYESLWSFILANGLAFLIGIGLLVRLEKKVINLPGAVKILPEVYAYARWVAISFGVASLAAKTDIPLVFMLAGSQAAGIYSSAQKLVSAFPQLAVAVEGVFSPKLSLGAKKSDMKEYFLMVAVVCLGLVIVTLLAPILVPLIFGEKYSPSIRVFQLLTISLVPFFLSGPLAAGILYRFGKSGYHLGVSLLMLLITVGGYLLLIPSLGASGAAIAAIISNLFGLGSYRLIFNRLKTK